jgi:PAS domain S-box-containing protein
MKKIFIVEDEWLVSLELQQRIKDLGYEIAGASDNGESAIEMILETKPDLILIDINIKGNIDGIETARRVLVKYNVPIIYLTAYSDKTTLERAKITTPYGYIIKPVEERDLLISIEISLNKFEMEKKLKDSENKLSITLQSIGDGVIATDEKGFITLMNKTAEKMCGWNFNEAKGINLNQVFNIKSAINNNTLENPVNEVLKTGNVIEMSNHTVLISRDGIVRHISDSAAPICDDSGEIQGVVLVFSDVTESYMNRELLKQSEKLYREVIEKATDIIYITDSSGKFIHVNEAALKSTGYTKKDLEDKTFIDLVAPEYREKTKRNYYRQFLGKKFATYCEIPAVKKNGDITWYGQNVTLILKDDKVAGFHVISRDITERKNAENALRKNEELLHSIIDIIPDRIFVKDVEGKFILNNISHLQSLGMKTQTETLGKTDFDFMSNELSLINEAEDKNVIEKKTPLIDNCLHEINEIGEEVWRLVSKLPLLTGDSKVLGTVGISKDITEIKKMEQEITEAKEKAEAANELKDAFIANISHEIRTPLNGVLGMTSIIKDVFSNQITPIEEEFFRGIDRSSKRIIRTVDMILNFSRLQVGEFKSNPKKIDLNNVLFELSEDFNLIARQRKLELKYENKIGNVMIQSDIYCLNQVLSNLLDNAVKYTRVGSVEIILYINNENNICIDIKDTGIGISEEYMDQIFHPYSQEEVGYTRAYEGVGLGLSLVKKFLFLIDADIFVKSKKGIGTTFTITFAKSIVFCNEEKPETLKTESLSTNNVEKNNGQRRPSILIVEDEEINQLFLTTKLKKNYNPTIVDNATNAMQILAKQQFDIILMDISLKGGLNGIELTRILKESDEYSSIPIIAVTGHAFDKDKDKCLSAGCNDYISKPFNIEELEVKIKKCLIAE